MNDSQSDQILRKFEERKKFDLIASLAIDAVGMASFALPALAEVSDVVLAPILSILIFAVHRTTFGAIAGFIEEIIPFTDIIPTATLIWLYRYVLNGDKTMRDFAGKSDKKKKIIEDVLNEKTSKLIKG